MGFRYPGSEAGLRHVSFHLRPGERIAFVGENGAGKTTLTKRRWRGLYDPAEGRILFLTERIRNYELESCGKQSASSSGLRAL